MPYDPDRLPFYIERGRTLRAHAFRAAMRRVGRYLRRATRAESFQKPKHWQA